MPVLETLAAVASLAVPLFKGVAFVREGEKGIKLRFGKAVRNRTGEPKIFDPGFTLMIPFVDTLARRHVRQQTINMGAQTLTIKGGLVYHVDAVIIFKVIDIYKALFEVDNLKGSIGDIGQALIREIFADLDYDTDFSRTNALLRNELVQKVTEWGVEVVEFKITQCTPSGNTENVIGLKKMIEMRIETLNSVGVNYFKSPATAAVLLGCQNVALPLQTVSASSQRVNNNNDDEEGEEEDDEKEE